MATTSSSKWNRATPRSDRELRTRRSGRTRRVEHDGREPIGDVQQLVLVRLTVYSKALVDQMLPRLSATINAPPGTVHCSRTVASAPRRATAPARNRAT